MTNAPSSTSTADTARQRRIKYGLSVTILLLSSIAILAIVNWLAVSSPFRWDLTAGRSYTLSPQTHKTLDRLTNDCTITLVFAERDPSLDEASRSILAARRAEVEDVLRQFTTVSSHVKVTRLDPSDRGSAVEYETLLSKLKTIFAAEIESYSKSVETGLAALDELSTFAANESRLLGDALPELPRTHAAFRNFNAIYQILTILPQEMQMQKEAVARMTETRPGQPVPDWEGAVSAIAQAASFKEATLRQIASIYAPPEPYTDLPPKLADYVVAAADRAMAAADHAADAAEKLRDLKPLGLSPIQRELARSACVILSTPDKASVLAHEDLFPRPNAREVQTQQRDDRRFAGERVVAGAIRRLLITDAPQVVICHADPSGTLLEQTQQGIDLSHVADELRNLGFEVSEWNILRGDKPDAPASAVWVVIPSQARFGDQMSTMAASALADAARDLVESGRNVLMSYWPSPMGGFGQGDFWAGVTKSIGVTPDTAKVILQRVPQPGEQDAITPVLEVKDFERDTVIGAALVGQNLLLQYPLPLILATDDSARRTIILKIPPTENIWADERWLTPNEAVPPATVPSDPYPVIVAVERGLAGSTQRCLVVGAGAWFYSVNTSREALIANALFPMNPGNMELFINGVCWLAGLDDSIAPSPWTQTISRVSPEMSSATLVAWQWILIAGLPVASLAAGVFTWFRRRG